MYPNPNDEAMLEGEPGSFVGRDAELEQFRQIIRDVANSRKGLFGSKGPKVSGEAAIRSRILLINGEPGSGKTRLGLQFRQIALKEKEFKGKFRASRLDWAEALGRDQRTAALSTNQSAPAEAALDILYTHFVRSDFEGQFEAYRKGVEDTKQLLKTVSGAELMAVWEFRARALGKGLQQTAQEKPLVFILDNFAGSTELNTLLELLLEESGSSLIFVLIGKNLPSDLKEKTLESRFFSVTLGTFNEEDLLRYMQSELTRYLKDDTQVNATDELKKYRTPEQVALLRQVTGGAPLAARLGAFLVQAGILLEDLPPGGNDPLEFLLEEFLEVTLPLGHPDRLKLYALSILRRPEPGLLAGLLDLRADMVSTDRLLDLLQTRYAFLFEPARKMVLHEALRARVRNWLLLPEHRQEEGGLSKINQRAVEFLTERLRVWGQNFSNLPTRIKDVKWSNWAVDLAWHSLWLDEGLGWREVLPIFIAGIEYKPVVADAVIEAMEQFREAGGLTSDESAARLKILKKIQSEPNHQESWKDLLQMGEADSWFEARWPQFAAQFEYIVEQKLGLA